MTVLRVSGLPPRPERVACTGTESRIDRPRDAPRRELHVHQRRFRVARALAVHQQLLHDADEQFGSGLSLARCDEGGAAELLGYCRRALLVRGIEHVAVELVNRRLLAASVVADVSRIVRRRDARGISDVDGRQTCRELANGGWVVFSKEAARIDDRYRDTSKCTAAGVAVIQRGVVVAGEQYGL